MSDKTPKSSTKTNDWPADKSVPVSVLIPVKNEEANIAECISALAFAEQVVVVDSQSKDQTGQIAESMGAEVVQFHYSKAGWPKKKNWALENIPWRHEWVLIIDADERMTPDLAKEIQTVVQGQTINGPGQHRGGGDGFYVNRRFIFMGRWIKHCGYFPSYNLRLFKHAVGRYERIGDLGDTSSGDNEVHEHVVLRNGSKPGYLARSFDHLAYPDLQIWIEKHNRYSNWEAHAMLADVAGELHASLLRGSTERRRWIKRKVRHLPFRPTLRFFYSYVIKLGFLDGYQGYVLSRLLSWYEFVSISKKHELVRLQEEAADLAEPPGIAGRPPALGEQTRKVAKPTVLDQPIKTKTKRANASRKQLDIEPPPRIDATVIILAYNEEQNIRACIRSVSMFEEVVVIDSGSDDRTCEIAIQEGAKVLSNPFYGFGQQRNFAIDAPELKRDWQMHLDADERMTPQLAHEIAKALNEDPAEAGYYLCCKLMFGPHWLKYSGDFPTYQMRLIHRQRCRYEDFGHGQREVTDGKTAQLAEPYLHYALCKGLGNWFEKHARYAKQEAELAESNREPMRISGLISGDALVRRRTLKALSWRLPFRSFNRFFYHTILRGGILDGRPGIVYALMMSIYESTSAIVHKWSKIAETTDAQEETGPPITKK